MTERRPAPRARRTARAPRVPNIVMIDRSSDLDNWAAMKQHALPDEDAHLFAESLGRGHAILVIRAASGDHDRIMQVLSRFNPIDIEEHAQQWRTAGWAGFHPGKAAWDGHRQNVASRSNDTTTAATSAALTT